MCWPQVWGCPNPSPHSGLPPTSSLLTPIRSTERLSVPRTCPFNRGLPPDPGSSCRPRGCACSSWVSARPTPHFLQVAPLMSLYHPRVPEHLRALVPLAQNYFHHSTQLRRTYIDLVIWLLLISHGGRGFILFTAIASVTRAVPGTEKELEKNNECVNEE